MNLFEEVDGKYPEDKERITGVIRNFLEMDPHQRMLYQVGRRLGLFSRLSDLNNSELVGRAEETCRQHDITPENVDSVINELMKRFI